MKNYKEYYKDYIGYSDIAALVLVGMDEAGLKSEMLRFGGDESYHAYIIDEEAEVPSHYELRFSFTDWLKIYDDEGLVRKFYADSIDVYRAGEYGCLIRIIGRRDNN